MPKSAATPPADGGEKAGAGMPSAPPKKEGKKRIKCAALKGGKIIVGKGEPINVDDDGFFEVSEAEAARLLTIPGYEEAKN
jgi:hypothetical protein